MIKPFIPPVVAGRPWQDHPTHAIASELRFFSFEPGAKWHGFEGYAREQYFVDPCKLLLTTPGIDAETGEYTDFGIPATILAHYLRENGIVPEKCDLNSILFLLTPAESSRSWRSWWRCWDSEQHIEDDTPLADVLPTIFRNTRCATGITLRQLCQEMHDLYVSFDVKDLQKAMFRREPA
jgi:ornithine decarboxylase